MSSTILRRVLPSLISHQPVSLAFTTPRARRNGTWSGRQPDEHVNYGDNDELDVLSSASESGKRQRAKGEGKDSSAATEKDPNKQNEKAQQDHPEAPGPVIGMNDERGGVSIRACVRWVEKENAESGYRRDLRAEELETRWWRDSRFTVWEGWERRTMHDTAYGLLKKTGKKQRLAVHKTQGAMRQDSKVRGIQDQMDTRE